MKMEPIRKVLMTPILLFGCERSLLIFIEGALFYSFVQGVTRGSSLIEYGLTALLAIAMPVVVIFLRDLAKFDPQFTKIYRRSIQYPKIIRATETPFAERRFKK